MNGISVLLVRNFCLNTLIINRIIKGYWCTKMIQHLLHGIRGMMKAKMTPYWY